MHPALAKNLYLVKEHVGVFKAANNFDIFDPDTGEEILHCREDRLGTLTRMLRFTDYKVYTPFDVELRTPSGEPILTVERGVSLFLSKVRVSDAAGTLLGGFQQKFFSIGGKFDVLDPSDAPLCTLRGKWTGWDFRFEAGSQELARVSKKWSGIGKEMFTSADNYMLSINEEVPAESRLRGLILAAVLCIDMVLKER